MQGYPSMLLSQLPPPEIIRRHAAAAAFLSALLWRDPNCLTFRFRPRSFDIYDIGSINNQQGDCITAAIGSSMSIVCGYNSSSPISRWPANSFDHELIGPQAILPDSLRAVLELRDFDHGGRTFAAWFDDGAWHVPDLLVSKNELREFGIPYLDIYALGAPAFIQWAHEDDGTDRIDSIAPDVFAWRPFSRAMIEKLLGEQISRIALDVALDSGLPLEP